MGDLPPRAARNKALARARQMAASDAAAPSGNSPPGRRSSRRKGKKSYNDGDEDVDFENGNYSMEPQVIKEDRDIIADVEDEELMDEGNGRDEDEEEYEDDEENSPIGKGKYYSGNDRNVSLDYVNTSIAQQNGVDDDPLNDVRDIELENVSKAAADAANDINGVELNASFVDGGVVTANVKQSHDVIPVKKDGLEKEDGDGETEKVGSKEKRQRRIISSDDDEEDDANDDEFNLDSNSNGESEHTPTSKGTQNRPTRSRGTEDLVVKLRLPLNDPRYHTSSGIVTKSGRLSKPVKNDSPSLQPSSRKRTSDDQLLELARTDRYPKRNTRSSVINFAPNASNDSFENGNVNGVERHSKRRKTGSNHGDDYDDADDEEDDEERDDDDDFVATGSGGNSRGYTSSRSRLRRLASGSINDDEGTIGKRRTRMSSRRQSTDNLVDDGNSRIRRYETRTARRRVAMNGSGKIGASRKKESDEDGGGGKGGDSDFQMSGGEESDEPSDEGIDEQELGGGVVNDSHGDSDCVGGARRKNGTRNNRKRLPQRTVRTRNRRKRGSNPQQNSFANEMSKSYRPRNESVRPSDFYNEGDAVSSDPSITSDDGVTVRRPNRRLRSSRTPRKSATRASDAIANELDRVDFLSNPMALVDGAAKSRPKRNDRFASRHRSNRRQPSNLDPNASDDDMQAQGSLAPIEPMQVDVNLSWDDIGGLDHHVRALKEMVFLPLLYPEVFEKFSMEPPKGVLFYGPPGTGKTLCARALAASCGTVEEEVVETMDDTKNVAAGISAAVTSKDDGKMSGDVAAVGDATKAPTAMKVEGGEGGNKETETVKSGDGSEANKVTGTMDGNPNEMNIDVPVLVKNETAASIIPGDVKDMMTSAEDVDRKSTDKPEAAMTDGEVTTGGGDVINAQTGGESNINEVKKTVKTVKKKQRVAFFMRNGADCLSKWVGEAERQLRMTFEAAKKHQPAIIFFDEIDGLAPVRSSKQDQIHSSIVSTLLGLMDGLDARGKIVVIGATNRVDAIDPALRRPGRFDRELIFTLPNLPARRRILNIHTAKWAPTPKVNVLDAVAKMTVGYCGADLKALCSESAIRALRRRYPQVYLSNDKLLIDVDQVRIGKKDFLSAMSDIVPASHRSARTFARPLPPRLKRVLGQPFDACVTILKKIFPQGLASDVTEDKLGSRSEHKEKSKGSCQVDENFDCLTSSDDEDNVDNVDGTNDGSIDVGSMEAQISNAGRVRPTSSSSIPSSLQVGRMQQALRPRLLICGFQGRGQGQLGPALLHRCEGCPVHAIDFSSLHADLGARSAEEALISAFREAARSVPSILYLPHMHLWWKSAVETLRTSLVIALKDLPSDLPLLVLATAEEDGESLPCEIMELFTNIYQLPKPEMEVRREMFAPVVEGAKARPKVSAAAAKKRRRQRIMEVLPKAPAVRIEKCNDHLGNASKEEAMNKVQMEDRCIRALRMEMREFVELLLRDRRYKPFWTAVDPTLAPDYYDIIKIPMDIQKIAANVDHGRYPTVLAMVNDFDIMVKNAIQYNPPNTEVGALILRRAHGLIDVVHAWVDNLSGTLVETCNKIIMERIERMRDDSDGGEKVGVRERTEAVNEKVGVRERTEAVNEKDVGGADLMDVDVIAAQNGNVNGKDDETEEAEEAEEAFLEAKEEQVRELEQLLLDVSTGMSIDALESLMVKCENVLHEFRHNMNRVAAVRELSTMVCCARDDPALVGKLVD